MGIDVLQKVNNEYTDGLVSVIMPAYNSGPYIADAVKSVLAQTYEKLELIISDDCSSDDTITIAKKAANGDERVNFISSKINTGVAEARNRALQLAAGRYIAFLDSDDIWMQDKLDKQIKAMKADGHGLSYGSYGFINEDGKISGNRLAKIYKNADYNSLLKDNFIGLLTVVIDRHQTGAFKFTDYRHEDLVLWLYFAKAGICMEGLVDKLAYYRISGGSLSGNKLKAASWRWGVYRKAEGLSLIKSVWYMANYIVNSIRKRVSNE
jgi:teichuronic acid biosynthesis glycosyltransferase TuaG